MPTLTCLREREREGRERGGEGERVILYEGGSLGLRRNAIKTCCAKLNPYFKILLKLPNGSHLNCENKTDDRNIVSLQ